jgi:hypothetical protein
MPRRKKRAQDLTTEEAIKKLFPKKIIEEVKKQVGTDSEQPINKKDST